MKALPWLPKGATLGLYGGSFDPPHAGHNHVAKTALRKLRLDQLWWMVTPANPLKSEATRLSWSERAAAIGKAYSKHPSMRVVTFEAEQGLHRTLDSLIALSRYLPEVKPVLILGADNLANFHHWQSWRAIADQIPLAVVDRPGMTLKAQLSLAARALSDFRLPESEAGQLCQRPAPVWCYLTAPKVSLSSTQIRSRAV